MLWAASCLAFLAFLRCREFMSSPGRCTNCLSVEDVSVDSHSHPTCITIILRHSKTDRLDKGVTISLRRTLQVLCPVTAVLSYLAHRPAGSGPLFVFPDRSPLSRSYLIAQVREALQCQGMNTALFSGLSFCIGAASTASEVGIGDAVIK